MFVPQVILLTLGTLSEMSTPVTLSGTVEAPLPVFDEVVVGVAELVVADGDVVGEVVLLCEPQAARRLARIRARNAVNNENCTRFNIDVLLISIHLHFSS
jgi:hypothetical protein